MDDFTNLTPGRRVGLEQATAEGIREQLSAQETILEAIQAKISSREDQLSEGKTWLEDLEKKVGMVKAEHDATERKIESLQASASSVVEIIAKLKRQLRGHFELVGGLQEFQGERSDAMVRHHSQHTPPR